MAAEFEFNTGDTPANWSYPEAPIRGFEVEFNAGGRIVTRIVPNTPVKTDEDGTRHYREVLTFSDNKGDRAAASRDVTVRVRALGASGLAYSHWELATCENVKPIISIAPIITPTLTGVTVNLAEPAGSDTKGYKAHLGTTNSFAIAGTTAVEGSDVSPANNCVYVGPSNTFSVDLPDDTPRYLRIIAEDVFGYGDSIFTVGPLLKDSIELILEDSETIELINDTIAEANNQRAIAEAALQTNINAANTSITTGLAAQDSARVALKTLLEGADAAIANSVASQTTRVDTLESRSHRSDGLATNATFSKWTGTYPVGFSSFGATAGFSKETTITSNGGNAMRFVTNASNMGATFSNTLSFAPSPDHEWLVVSLGVYLVSGTFNGSGILIDGSATSGGLRLPIPLLTEFPTSPTGKWLQVRKLVRRTTRDANFVSYRGYLMADYSSNGLGSVTAKDIIFDRFDIRPATQLEIDSQSVVNDVKAGIYATDARVTGIETTITTPVTGYAAKIAALETTINTPSTGLSAKYVAQQQAITDLTNNKAAASDVSSLQTEVTGGRGSAASLAQRFNLVESDVAGRATNTALTSLSSTVTTKNRSFVSATAPSGNLVAGDLWMDQANQNRIKRWSGSTWDDVSDSRGQAALDELTAARPGFLSLSAKLADMTQTTTDALALKATASSVSSMGTEITNAREGQLTLAANITSVRNAISTGDTTQATRSSVIEAKAKNTLAATLPSTFVNNGDGFSEGYNDATAALPDLPTGNGTNTPGVFTAADSSSYYLYVATTPLNDKDIYARSKLAIVDAEVWELKAVVEQVTGTGTSAQFAFRYFNAGGAFNNVSALGPTTLTPVGAKTTISLLIGRNPTPAGGVALDSASSFFRVAVRGNAGGTPGGFKIHSFSIRNVTQERRLSTAESTITSHDAVIVNLPTNYTAASTTTALSSKVDLKNRAFFQGTQPANPSNGLPLVAGDMWMNTSANNFIKRWSGTAWVDAHDVQGANALAEIVASRNGSPSLNAQLGDMRQTVVDGLAGKASATAFSTLNTEVTNARLGTASLSTRLTNIQSSVDGKASATDFETLEAKTNVKVRTFTQNSAPANPTGGYNLVAGDLWINTTSSNNVLNRWSGSAWVVVGDTRGADALAEIINARDGGVSLNARITGIETTATTDRDASALSIGQLQASVSPSALNANSTYLQWNTAATLPTGWLVWNSGSGTSRVAGSAAGPWAVRQVSSGASDFGLQQTPYVTGQTGGGYVVVEATVKLIAGSLRGSGVRLWTRNSSGSTVTPYLIDFADDKASIGTAPGAGTTGRTYSYSKLFDVRGSSVAQYQMQALTRASDFSPPGAVTLEWQSVSVRNATRSEIESGDTSAITAAVTELQEAVATLDGETRARWAIGTAVPGASAFIEARAETTAGQTPTSSVAIGARVFALYNTSNAGWLPALTVTGGNAIFTGGLQAGTFIRLGSGAGWPVALQSKTFNMADGATLSFGTDLGALPSYEFLGNGLLPLAAGETYDLRLNSLTNTGATVYAKIVTPSSPTAISLTTDASASGGPTRQINKSSNPDSADGTYTYRASGTATFRFISPGAQGEPMDLEGTVTLSVWGYKSSTWVEVGTMTTQVFYTAQPSSNVGYQTASVNYDFSETIQVGTGATYFGVGLKSKTTYQATLTDLDSVSWTAAGTPSGTRSALASGAKTNIKIIPRN